MIRLLVLDVDGTLTDGKIYMSAQGELIKAFNIKDGLAIARLARFGVTPVILTGRNSQITATRCAELNITEIYQGVENKVDVLAQIAAKHSCNMLNIAFVGDDINDLACLKLVGFSACPADAAKQVINQVHYVSSLNGGDGAVREIIEKLIEDGQIPTEVLA